MKLAAPSVVDAGLERRIRFGTGVRGRVTGPRRRGLVRLGVGPLGVSTDAGRRAPPDLKLTGSWLT